jgi:Lrp/AsnC family leucine-responsive transcriptional regulator
LSSRDALDRVDAKLLDLLQEDCSRPLHELGERVGLSISAVNERLRRLRARGDIRAYVALVEPQNLGYAASAFVAVMIESSRHEREFVRRMTKVPGVLECHHVTGELQYLVRVWSSDLAALDRVIETAIRTCPGVVRVSTMIVLSSAKESVTGLPAGAP